MNILKPALILGLTLVFLNDAIAWAADDDRPRLSARALEATLSFQSEPRREPGGYRGVDSCRRAENGECDEPGIGTGLCSAGTDYSDCWRIAENAPDNSCEWSNDGICDEPGFGTGFCRQATDVADCSDSEYLRFRDDSCETAFDGVCNEAGLGDGTCQERSDRSDCLGRERPAGINDHFMRFDDRQLISTATAPWRSIGLLRFNRGGVCTATLVAEDVILTAAHCLFSTGELDARARFTAGRDHPDGERSARVTAYLLDPDFDVDLFFDTHERDGQDWALLRLSRPLGRTFGHVEPIALSDLIDNEETPYLTISQAGYSWDTGGRLSGHRACRITRILPNNAILHDCDTTRRDSGSPLLVERDGNFQIIAVDSRHRRFDDPIPLNVAARTDRLIEALPGFINGESGERDLRPRRRRGLLPWLR